MHAQDVESPIDFVVEALHKRFEILSRSNT